MMFAFISLSAELAGSLSKILCSLSFGISVIAFLRFSRQVFIDAGVVFPSSSNSSFAAFNIAFSPSSSFILLSRSFSPSYNFLNSFCAVLNSFFSSSVNSSPGFFLPTTGLVDGVVPRVGIIPGIGGISSLNPGMLVIILNMLFAELYAFFAAISQNLVNNVWESNSGIVNEL